MQNPDTLSEKKDLYVRLEYFFQQEGSWREAAARRNIPAGPFEPATEETFGQWLTSILAGDITPDALDPYNDIYELIHTFDPARNMAQKAIQAAPEGIWFMLDALGPMLRHSGIELLADYLVTHPVAKSHIIPAIKRPLPGCSELNPEGLQDIDLLITKSKDEQLWSFLDTSIPSKDIGVWLTFETNASIADDGTIHGVKNTVTSNIDGLYSGMVLWDMKQLGLENKLPYLPLLKSCYHAYDWNLSVKSLTDKQRQKLTELMQNGSCQGTVRDIALELKPGTVVVPALFSITIGDIHHTANGFLYTADDIPEYDEEDYDH